jgi:hypothetical protein
MGFWPFNKKENIEQVDPATLNYTQVDITENFDDDLSFTDDDWIKTMHLNNFLGNDNQGNLPALGASTPGVWLVVGK